VERISDITRDCFNALIQLRRVDEAALPPADALQGRLRGFVDAMLRKAGEAGLSGEDAQDIAYAVVALADEIVMGRSEELRNSWADRLLQLHYFHENVAGEAFFTRLAALRRDPRKREILQAYYTALQLGYQGRYRVRGGDLELMTLTEELQRELSRGGRFDDVLSPRGERPQEAEARGTRTSTMLWVALAVVVVSLALYAGLYVSSSASASKLADRISTLQKR
jgi:type VI secretion system protein ImpK